MHPWKRLIEAFVVGIPVIMSAPAQAEQVLASQEGITVILPDDFSCAENIRLKLTAEDASPFADEGLMSRLAGQLSALMAFDCSQAKNIRMEGFVDTEQVYRAQTSDRSDWTVMTMLAPESDRAEPRGAPGVSTEQAQIAGGGLLPVLPDPASPGASQDSASARVADLRASDQTSSDDATALDRLSAIGGGAEAGTDRYWFDEKAYSRAGRVNDLYAGNFEKLRELDFEFSMVYFIKMNEYFSRTMNWFDDACAAYGSPDLATGVHQKIIGTMMQGGGMRGAEFLAEQLIDMSNNPTNFLNRVARFEAEQKAAEVDGTRLARDLGCESPVFFRLHSNLVAFVEGRDPVAAFGWPGLQLACIDFASTDGGLPSTTRAQCRCIEQALKSENVPEETAEWMRAGYEAGTTFPEGFATVLANYPAARKPAGLCLLQ